jgi:hypothetical protein
MMTGWQVAEFFIEADVSGSVPLADRPEPAHPRSGLIVEGQRPSRDVRPVPRGKIFDKRIFVFENASTKPIIYGTQRVRA